MENLNKLSDLIFDIKTRLSDLEYLLLCDTLKTLAIPKELSIEVLMEVHGLEPGIASFIFCCLKDRDYSNRFCFVGEEISTHLIFPDISSGEEWSPRARSHPMSTRSQRI